MLEKIINLFYDNIELKQSNTSALKIMKDLNSSPINPGGAQILYCTGLKTPHK